MDNELLVKHWVDTSDEDFNAALVLFNNKCYPQALFFGHLATEKLLKALYAKLNKDQPHAPKVHDLPYLAQKCNLELCEEKEDKLEAITKFNLNTRYDEQKRAFYKMCTKEFTAEQMENIKEIRSWLKKLIAE